MKLIQTIECKYEGDFQDGKMDGFGTIFNQYGEKLYQGEFRKGKLNGVGKLWNQKLDSKNELTWGFYEGEFQDDVKEGAGQEEYTNGDKFVGQFRNDLKDGLGQLHTKDKVVFGLWSKG